MARTESRSQLNRDSLSTDPMEPVRPIVDRYVFGLLASRRFAADDFFETRQGVCRVTASLARELALAALDWGRAVGRFAEDVARRPEHGGKGDRCPRAVSAAAIARATGLSRGYCQLIKRGDAVPHPMWWETLAELPALPQPRRSPPSEAETLKGWGRAPRPRE
jgi:hypothetical protein